MTSRLYTREEMVEAHIAGSREWVEIICAMRGTNSAAHEADIIADARKYVDGLQDAPSGPGIAAPVDLLPESRPSPARREIAALEAKFNEFVLKTKEREVALARILGPMITKLVMHQALLTPTERSIAWCESWITDLNTYFPELTEGAE